MAEQKPISIKYMKFIAEYLKHGDGTKAYLSISDKATKESATAISSKLLKDERIAAYITEQREILSKKGIIDASEVLQTIADTMRQTKNDNVRLKAAGQLANILGMNKAATPIIPVGESMYSNLSDEQLEKLLIESRLRNNPVIPTVITTTIADLTDEELEQAIKRNKLSEAV